jgi:hypothetical protein
METAVKIPRAQKREPKSPNARAFAAGTGVTAALITAAILAFASVAAYVAFEGVPFGSGNSADSTVSLETSGAPEVAALAARQTADAVAADPADLTPAALAEIAAALPPGAIDGPGGPGGPGPGNNPNTGGTDGGGPGPVDPVDPVSPGTLGGTVGAVDDAAGGLGLDLPLQDLTDPITQPADDIVGGTLNNAGNGLGAGNNLGDNVNGAVNGLLGGS